MLTIGNVTGLPEAEQAKLNELVRVFNAHCTANEQKDKYYEGAITLQDVNLGIALPSTISNLKIGCEWGSKTVDVLAARSMFDGFVSSNGDSVEELTQIVDDNQFLSQYSKACRDELKYGCTFATLSADDKNGCKIRFHSPKTASALWNGEKGDIDCGMAIIDTVKDEMDIGKWTPSHINLYTDNAIWVIRKNGTFWEAVENKHTMGRPMMVSMVWNATNNKPFGRSRLKAPIRALIDGYIRTIANAAIALEFDTAPQKYILGVTDEQYDAIVSNKFKQYVGSILAATQNPETGENPNYGQLPQGSLSPHVEMIRILATQFSAATGLTVTDTGVVNDANPTSSEAILAQSQTLVLLAEQLNAGNSHALRLIARMALAIVQKTTLENLDDADKAIIAHFKNPAMPSVSVTTDAALKIASTREGFSGTDMFLEMVGFSQADIRRIKAQEQRIKGQQTIMELQEQATMEEPQEVEEVTEESEDDGTEDALNGILEELNGLLEEIEGM